MLEDEFDSEKKGLVTQVVQYIELSGQNLCLSDLVRIPLGEESGPAQLCRRYNISPQVCSTTGGDSTAGVSSIMSLPRRLPSRAESMNLRGLVKVRGEFSLMCLVRNVKKTVKKVLEGTVSLPGKYSKLMEEAMPRYREEQLTLVGTSV